MFHATAAEKSINCGKWPDFEDFWEWLDDN